MSICRGRRGGAETASPFIQFVDRSERSKRFLLRICRFRCNGNQTENSNTPTNPATAKATRSLDLNYRPNPTQLNSTQLILNSGELNSVAHVASMINKEDDDDDNDDDDDHVEDDTKLESESELDTTR